MAWQTVPGLAGKVYIPDYQNGKHKNPCAQCFVCQQCSNERCAVCTGTQPKPRHPETKGPCSPREVCI